VIDDNFFLALIGAGNLGSRYLQGLAQSSCNLSIVVIDPNPKALALAKQRLAEVKGNCQIDSVEYAPSLDAIKNDLDLAIVATNADVRREVLEALLQRVKVRYLVLEKVVFQCAEDFRLVQNMLRERKIKAWVNCPRRMTPFFRDVQKKISSRYRENIAPISLSVIGNNWGLASNSIHFFDLLAFFSRRTTVKIDVSGLDQEIYQSKRRGFVELSGSLVAGNKLGDQISLVDNMGERRGLEVNISFPGAKIELQQLGSGVTTATWFDFQEQSSTVYKFRMPFQSELTSMLVEQILIEGSSFLTPLNESESIHILMLNAFTQHISTVTGTDSAKCPIT
jgi:hypothetical protein